MPMLRTSDMILLYAETLRSTKYAAEVEGKIAALVAIMRTLDAASDDFQQDGDLTPQGKGKAVRQAAATALQEIAAWETAATAALESAIRTISARVVGQVQIVRPTDPADRLAYELRLQEVRAELRKLDPLERTAIFISTQDPVIVDACETAPPTLERLHRNQGALPTLVPFVDEETRRMAFLARAEQRNPEAAAQMREFGNILQIYRTAAGNAREAVLQAVPSLRPDPVADVVGVALEESAKR